MYLVKMEVYTIASGLQLSVVESDGDYSDQLSVGEAGFAVHLPVAVNGPDLSRDFELGFDNLTCDVEVAAGCTVPVPQSALNVPSTPGYHCEKQIDELTMIWAGEDAVRIVAHRGKLSDPVIADIDNVVPGAEVKISGFADGPKDVIWEIFIAGTNTKIGESSFHLSCSDSEMKNPQDCGKPAGDGKNNDKCTGGDGRCLNDWIFEGLVDKEGEINCTEDYPTNQLGMEWSTCEISGSGFVNFQYSLIAGSESVHIQSVTDSALGALPGVPPEALSPGGSASFYYSDQVEQSQIRQLSITGVIDSTGQSCIDSTVIEIDVLPTPDACDLIDVTLKSMTHDKVELEVTNQGSESIVVTGLRASWPQENEKLKEIKISNGNVLTHDIAWQEVVYVTESDLTAGSASRTVVAGSDQILELKFTKHVHDSEQVYDIDLDFGPNCSVNINNLVPTVPILDSCELIAATLKHMSHDKVELKITNEGSSDVVVTGLTVSWPEENEKLKEIKTHDGNVLTDHVAWQSVVSIAETDFSAGPASRTVESGGDQKFELKFTKHVHDSEQVYDINLNLDSGCSVHFNNTEN